MKKWMTAALSVLMLLTLALPARGDILWEPMDNNFYDKHREECTYVGRNYIANGEEGFVTVRSSPENGVSLEKYTNGTAMHVYWQYGEWALVMIRDGETAVEGWVSLEEMNLSYDGESFAEEYAQWIRPYNGEFANYDGDAEGVNFYAYPGAPEVKLYVPFSNGNVRGNLTGTADTDSYIQSVFVDEEERTWGFVGYMYGRVNAWFCLDAPEGLPLTEETRNEPGAVFPLREVQGEEVVPARTPHPELTDYLPWLLVGGVTVITAVVLAVFFRKKKTV